MKPLHNVKPIPEGRTVAELIPAFANVEHEIHVGKPNSECASCRKPFNVVRKRRKAVRLYPIASPVPLAYAFDICGHCLALHHAGGAGKDGVLAAVEAYCDSTEAAQ